MNATVPANKTSRKISVVIPLLDEPSVGVVAITDKGRTDEYMLWRQPSTIPYTRGFRLTKISDRDSDGYDVLVDQVKPELSTCECMGHLSRGRCRHVSGLAALMKCGKLS